MFSKKEVTLLLIYILSLVLFMLYISKDFVASHKPKRTLEQKEKIEHAKLLKKHGLLWEVSVILVKEDGTKWFERKGKMIKFQ